MTKDHISRIEAALEAGPTSGHWVVDSGSAMLNGAPVVDEYFVRREDDDTSIAAGIVDPETGLPSAVNADYIAACNPTAIRALLDRLKAAEQRAEHWKAEHLAGNAEVERLREALEAVVAYRTGGLIEGLCRAALEAPMLDDYNR